MKNKIMTTNIGTINLAEIDIITDCMEIFIPIVTVSENLRATIEKSIKTAKEKYQHEYLDCRAMKWSDAGVSLSFQELHIIIESGHISYELCFNIEDKENDFIETGFNLKVDLSEHTEEIKKLIIKAMIDKFF